MNAREAIAALRFLPLLPPALLLLLAGLAVLVVALSFWRRARGAWWRLGLFATLLLWLAGPSLITETHRFLPDIGLLLVDHSASMRVGGRMALADAAAAKLAREARAIPGLEWRTVTIPEQGASGTRLFAAMRRALADIPRDRLAGVVAITDGEASDATAHPHLPAPLHVLIPARGEQTDRRIRIVSAPAYGIVGQTARVDIAIEDMGLPDRGTAIGRSVPLTIRRDGAPPVVQSVAVGPTHEIDLPITAEGPSVIELSVPRLRGEASGINNRSVLTINGVRDRLRVLLVSGRPHPGERTWRRLLKADPSVDLVHFTILRPPSKDDLTPLNELSLISFPVYELFQVKIRQFDLIILDRYKNRGLLPPRYIQNIVDYVRAGGALLVSVGREFAGNDSLASSPLAAVLPALPADFGPAGIVDAPFRPFVTALGQRDPVTADLPGWNGGDPLWGPWYRYLATQPNPDVPGDVLMRAGPAGGPLLVTGHVGRGRVAMLLSDQIWLWSRGHLGGGPQAELLRRIAHWSMGEPSLAENRLTAHVARGVLTVERRSLAANPPTAATVTGPDGKRHPLTLAPVRPGLARGQLPAPEVGVWRADAGGLSAFAAAGPADPPEFADLRATASILAPAVAASHGSVTWLDPHGAPALRMVEPGGLSSGDGWIGLLRRHAHVVTGIDVVPLIPDWAALSLILLLAVLAWRREGR
ncbi:MAG: hypothetical protein KGK10_14060 [Rhodospirillales bacterium]|nr:hypothetical protein [Rhodospirillales bacterium]